MKVRKWILYILGLVILAAGIGYIAFEITTRRDNAAIYDDIQPELPTFSPTVILPTPTVAPATSAPATAGPSPEPTPTPEPYESPVDFGKLWETNPDIYAWIDIPGTVISYPVLQSQNDPEDYYLDHTVERRKGYPGSIYSQMANKKDFSDFNTVLYGHNMKDGSMFAGLHKYRNLDYLKEHREIKVYLPDGEKTYQIFAALVYDNKLIIKRYPNDDPAKCQKFLDRLNQERDLNNNILDDIPVTVEDHILTLSTCIGGRPKNRFIVVAVQTDEKP